MPFFTVTLRGAAFVLSAGLALVVGLSLAAHAQEGAYAPADQPQLSTSSPAPGGDLKVSGGGFGQGTPVRVVIFSEPVLLGTATADAAGEVSLDVSIPANFEPGSQHRIELQGTDPSGEPRVISRAVTLAGGDQGVLPFTGAAVGSLIALGGGILVLGGIMVAKGRGRHTVRAS